MVSAVQLRAQQQQLRTIGRRASLRTQQEALRRGISQQQVSSQEQVGRFEAERALAETEQKLITKDILDKQIKELEVDKVQQIERERTSEIKRLKETGALNVGLRQRINDYARFRHRRNDYKSPGVFRRSVRFCKEDRR